MKNELTEMQADVTEISITDIGIFASATCGKVSAVVSITDCGVKVISNNAKFGSVRGWGRQFLTVADALSGYKSAEMKAIISAVDSLDS